MLHKYITHVLMVCKGTKIFFCCHFCSLTSKNRLKNYPKIPYLLIPLHHYGNLIYEWPYSKASEGHQEMKFQFCLAKPEEGGVALDDSSTKGIPEAAQARARIARPAWWQLARQYGKHWPKKLFLGQN